MKVLVASKVTQIKSIEMRIVRYNFNKRKKLIQLMALIFHVKDKVKFDVRLKIFLAKT